jgi:hypothetical protein
MAARLDLPPPETKDRTGGGGSEWVELTRADNDIDAHLLAGRLAQEGIENRWVKDRSGYGAWMYGGSNPWAPVTILVQRFQLEDARMVLAEVSFDSPAVEPQHATDRPRHPRSGMVAWWVIALALGILFTAIALMQTARSMTPCPAGATCGQPAGPQP